MSLKSTVPKSILSFAKQEAVWASLAPSFPSDLSLFVGKPASQPYSHRRPPAPGLGRAEPRCQGRTQRPCPGPMAVLPAPCSLLRGPPGAIPGDTQPSLVKQVPGPPVCQTIQEGPLQSTQELGLRVESPGPTSNLFTSRARSGAVLEYSLPLTPSVPLHGLFPSSDTPFPPDGARNLTSFSSLQKYLPSSTRSHWSPGLQPLPAPDPQLHIPQRARAPEEDTAWHPLSPMGFLSPPGDSKATPGAGWACFRGATRA